MSMSSREQQFSALYEELAAKVYRHVRLRVGSEHDAEDIVAQTFMKTWDYVNKGKIILNKKAFVFRVANNLIIDWYRAKNTRPIPMEDVEEAKLGVTENNWDEAIDARHSLEQVEQALDQLDPSYRDAIVLQYMEGHSVKDVAKKLKVSENVVYVRVHRGRKKLMEILGVVI